MKNKRTPDIRFPGFTGDWEQYNLGNVSTKIGSGKTPKGGNQNYKSEGIPLLRSQNIFNNKVNFNDVVYITPEIDEDMANSRVQKGDVLLNITGASIGRSAVYKLNHKANVNQHVSIIRPSGEVNPYFIQLNITSEKGQKQIELNQAGGGREGLNFQQIAKMDFYFPDLLEQGEIGDFFIKLDNTIAFYQQELTTLKQTKQGFLQKMFPKEGESVPEVRFPGFTGDWEDRKLGDVTERVRGNDGRMDLPTLTISAGSGWLDQRERFSGNIAGKEQKNYTLLSKGELSYNHGNSKLAKYGAVFELRTYEEALVPRVYHSFKTTEETSSEFLEYMFATKIPDKELAKLISSGARMDGLLNINYDEFMGIKITIPKIEEQMKMAKFLRKLDDTIALHQRELDALKETKKAFLQKMFV
ncbi:restriction endonuclease subunit S [Bacillus cereus]|uniref:restriction endonuclease subunit S n=1 Tax=Bacillus cereus TaxID=1396 RepID=UPI003013185B